MIVMKFGGTSVESATAIHRVAGIVRSQLHRRPVVVVSAMGKTTNRLLAIARAAADGDQIEANRQLADLRAFHQTEASAATGPSQVAELDAVLDSHFRELESLIEDIAEREEFTPQQVDAVSAMGERLSSAIVTLAFRHAGIGTAHVDSRQVIVTDTVHTQAAPLYARSYARLKEVVAPLASERCVVMGGFISSTTTGVTTTLGRGGSDFTASIVGAGIDAEEIQIWTDVDGMLTCDPRIVSGGHRVRIISFAEAAELAYFGAKVLHPSTVLPAVEKNIPVLILNSRRPGVEGTRIVADGVPSPNPVKSIACKSGVTLVNIQSLRMLGAYGFLRRIFEVFDRHRTSVDIITTSEVSVSLTLDQTAHLPEIQAELERIAEISVEDNQASICLVGDNICHTPGVAARVFQALGRINVRMVSQGASRLNLSIVVAAQDLKPAVAALHDEFFKDLDRNVFEPAAAQGPNA